MGNLSQIVEFKEEKFGLFKAKNEDGELYAFLSKVSAYFIEDTGEEFITRYLDKNKELIGKRNDTVKCSDIWNVGTRFTVKELCDYLEKNYYLVDGETDSLAFKYASSSSSIMQFYNNYKTKNVIDWFKYYGAVIDTSNVEKVNVHVSIIFNYEGDNDIDDITLLLSVSDIKYCDTKRYYRKYTPLNDENDIDDLRTNIMGRIRDFFIDLTEVFGRELLIIFDDKIEVDDNCNDDENFSKLVSLVDKDIKRTYIMKSESIN